MDLINATAESFGWWCDGVRYDFPPGELCRVSDEVGNHMLIHLETKGLQAVRYGDDPEKISLTAIHAIVMFHKQQIATYNAMNEEQDQQKLSKLPKPEGVIEAEAKLKAYEPAYQRMLKDASEAEQAEITKSIERGLQRRPEIPNMDDMDMDQLRTTLVEFGGEPGRMSTRKSLVAAIKKRAAEMGVT